MRDVGYYHGYQDDRDLWCIFKTEKNSSFHLGKVIWIDGDATGVTEYGYGEMSHTVKNEHILTKSYDYKALNEMIQNYESMIHWTQKTFKCCVVALNAN